MEKIIRLNITVRYSDGKGDPEFLEKQAGNVIKNIMKDIVNKKTKEIYNIQIDDIEIL